MSADPPAKFTWIVVYVFMLIGVWTVLQWFMYWAPHVHISFSK